MKLSELTDRTKRITVTFGSEELWVDYRPGALTPAMQDVFVELQERAASGSEADRSVAMVEATVGLVETLVAAWDLTDGPDPVPVTADVIRSLPVDFLNAVVGAIQESMRPDPPKPVTSDGG